MSFIIAFNTLLGNISRMMCRNILKITLEDHVQHYVEDDLEDDVEHMFSTTIRMSVWITWDMLCTGILCLEL